MTLCVKVVEGKQDHPQKNFQDVRRDDAPNVSGAIQPKRLTQRVQDETSMATRWALEGESVGKFSNKVPSMVLWVYSGNVPEDIDLIFCRGSSV
jgi:hypothetical protein